MSLPIIYLPMRYFKHKKSIEDFFKVVFMAGLKNPTYYDKDEKEICAFEHPEQLFSEGQVPDGLELVKK